MKTFAIALGFIATGAFACGSAQRSASPRDSLAALQGAANRGDAAALYALLPARAQRDEPFEQFRARIGDDRAELHDLASAIETALGAQRPPTAELPLRNGGTAAVVDDPEGWRIGQPGFGPPIAPTPADAARALRLALIRRSLPGILQALAGRARGNLQAEMAALIEALAEPASLTFTPISSTGQRVQVVLPNGRSMTLVREGDDWRVEDVQ